MGDKTSIQWTDATWNPVRGCSRVSPGCENCYAERVAARFSGPGKPYHGLAIMGDNGPRWTRKVRMVPEHLADPLRWKKPRRIFVNSMSDLFHEGLTNEHIGAIFGVMAVSSQHTFQVLTKRARRMRDWFAWVVGGHFGPRLRIERCAVEAGVTDAARWPKDRGKAWPLPNVWLGVSAEDQLHADQRIPELLQTPADVRFVSYEPALGPVDFGSWLHAAPMSPDSFELAHADAWRPKLDWIIVGGESGPNCRPFHPRWARSVVHQCGASGVACFVKQMGRAIMGPCDGFMATPRSAFEFSCLSDPQHGGDPNDWPADLRVRDFPFPKTRTA